ncbi:PDxFFG protein [Mycoplasma hafezii]|uniref:PDxFFG protein n=1 Tax=Mycoplasma hafezii TaxID=525886 RepID=UPI003CED8E1A
MAKKLSLTTKVLISLGVIGAGFGAAYGAMYGYASNSDEVKGSEKPFTAKELANNYSKIRNEKGELNPTLAVLNPLKDQKVAKTNADGTLYWFIDNPSEKMDLDTFFKKYYEIYQEDFILEVKYASFSFYNEYVLAVKPAQFIEFTKWFMNNVAWGPDILTLESFRIVRGAEQRGNSITLGSHATDKKESSEIKFFPDAFFGSLPIYNQAGGRGLAPDSLAYSTFAKNANLKTLEQYLKNIPMANALLNNQDRSFTDSYTSNVQGASRDKRPNIELFNGILIPGRLVDKQFLVYKEDTKKAPIDSLIDSLPGIPEELKKVIKQSMGQLDPKLVEQVLENMPGVPEEVKEMLKKQLASNAEPAGDETTVETSEGTVTQKPLLVLPKDITAEQFAELKAKNPEFYGDLTLEQFKLYEVADVTKETTVDPSGKVTPIVMKVSFVSDSDKHGFDHYYKEVPDTFFDMVSLETYRKAVNTKFENFLDFYGYEGFIGKTIYWYQKEDKNFFYGSLAQAQDSLNQKFLDSQIAYKVTQFKKEKAGDGSFNLYAYLENKNQDSALAPKVKIVKFNSKELENLNQKIEFFQFKQALGYTGTIKPTVLAAGPENVTLKDPQGNQIKGLAAREYQLYSEVYSGLLDIILTKYPHLLKEFDGPHVEETLNDEGFYEYKVVDGKYKGLNDGDRIGLPLVLNALIDNYEGISTDFLKYVGAHEYGHHYTLEGSQALNNQNNSVIVGGLSTRGGVNIQSYYAVNALMNYLKARTGLDIVRVDALGNPQEKGEFIHFNFKHVNKDGWFKETDADVWGTPEKTDDVYKVIDNKLRRFLQNYDTMLDVAKLRDVRLGDLYIANSFDRNSGTLNPFIEGTLSAFKSTKQNEFEEITGEKIMNVIVDGVGQRIPYSVDANGDVTLHIVDSKKVDGRTVYTKVNVFDRNGNPVIDIPLNTPLDAASRHYIETKIKVINDAIINLIDKNGYDSGWNQASTILGGQPEITFTNPISGENFKQWADTVKSRKDPVETDPYYNVYGYSIDKKTRTGYSYLSLMKDNNALSWWIGRMSALSKFNFNGMPEHLNIINATKNVGKYDGSLAAINPVIYFKGANNKAQKYSFPYVANSNTTSIIYQVIKNVKDTAEKYQLTVPYGNFIAGFDLYLLNQSNSANAKIGFLANGTFSDQPSSPHDPVVVLLNSFDNVDSALQASFVPMQDVVVNGKLQKALVFSDYQAYFEFFSVDYSQFTRVGLNQARTDVDFNANIEYVKTKFNLNIFKAQLLKSLTTANADEKAAINKIVQNEQSLANAAMKRMRNSGLFFTVKDFNPAYELVKNQAIFSTDYGIPMLVPHLKNNFYLDKSFIPNGQERISLTIEKLQELILDTATKAGITDLADLNNLNSFDLYMLIGNVLMLKNKGINTDAFLNNMVFSNPSTGAPSSDFQNYNLSRVEPLINDKFTDYIYSFPETLTRDYVQTTYVPNVNNFGNLPSFLNNVNEATTGLDYIVDATQLAPINETKINNNEMNLAQITVSQFDLFNATNAEITKVRTEGYKKAQIAKPIIESLKLQIKEQENNPDKELAQKQIEALQAEINKQKEYLSQLGTDVQDIRDKYNEDNVVFDENSFVPDQTDQRNSSYFGQLITKSNGYFKDRWQKLMINMELYDNNGNPVKIPEKDQRLTSFDGTTKIDNVPEAFFVSQLLNFGVGSRNITGIFRNKKFDALAMFGYIETKHAEKVKYIKFTNKDDAKDVAYLPVNTTNTNNVFYLQKQGETNSKKTLADYGYTSWISDFDYMGKYRGSLLQPKSTYYVQFVDENKETIVDMTLGDVPALAENGKLLSQAPVKLIQEKDEDGKPTGKVLLTIDYQFNILG